MRHHIAYAVTLLLGLVIAYLTLGPAVETEAPVAHFDKISHVLAFACLGFPLAAAGTHRPIWIFLAGLAYGAIIEIIQPSFGRTAEWADLAADAAGVGLGVAVGYIFLRVTLAR